MLMDVGFFVVYCFSYIIFVWVVDVVKNMEVCDELMSRYNIYV